MLGLVAVLILISLYIYVHRNFNYWARRGIPGPKPFPIIGNFGRVFIGMASNGQIITETYKKYTDLAVVGLHRAVTPLLVVRDPDFIKCMATGDFKYFPDNDWIIEKEVDPLLGRNPLALRGEAWKKTRIQLSHCFTTGKMKQMYVFLENTSRGMINYIAEESKIGKCMEARDICKRYTLNNVANCAFGLEGKAFDQPYSEFRELADNFWSPGGSNNIKFFLFLTCPWIAKYITLKIIPESAEQQVLAIVRAAIKYRKENNFNRNDFLDTIIEMGNALNDGSFTDVDIAAHAATFFSDGYETSSRVMSFILFELASNLEAQEKLRDELNELAAKNYGKLNYDIVHDSKYLDACFYESLRKNAIFPYLAKLCAEDYTYTCTNPDFKPITITVEAGTSIALPMIALHNDPKYFKDPHKYIPERFLDGTEIHKFAFLPWGVGGRICLGERFGTTQVKVGIANVIKNFKLTAHTKTRTPLQFAKNYVMLHTIGGLWIDFEKID